MSWKCPTCKKTFTGKNAYNRVQKCLGSHTPKKGKGYEKKVYTLKKGGKK